MPKTSPASVPLRVPTGKQVYDALMAKIEPELLADAIPALEEKYKDEAKEARAARYKRYREAFVQYDRTFAAFAAELRKAVDACRAEAEKTSLASVLEPTLDPPAP